MSKFRTFEFFIVLCFVAWLIHHFLKTNKNDNVLRFIDNFDRSYQINSTESQSDTQNQPKSKENKIKSNKGIIYGPCPCMDGLVCDDGICKVPNTNKCLVKSQCQTGQICLNGTCIDEPTEWEDISETGYDNERLNISYHCLSIINCDTNKPYLDIMAGWWSISGIKSIIESNEKGFYLVVTAERVYSIISDKMLKTKRELQINKSMLSVPKYDYNEIGGRSVRFASHKIIKLVRFNNDILCLDDEGYLYICVISTRNISFDKITILENCEINYGIIDIQISLDNYIALIYDSTIDVIWKGGHKLYDRGTFEIILDGNYYHNRIIIHQNHLEYYLETDDDYDLFEGQRLIVKGRFISAASINNIFEKKKGLSIKNNEWYLFVLTRKGTIYRYKLPPKYDLIKDHLDIILDERLKIAHELGHKIIKTGDLVRIITLDKRINA